MVTAPELAPKLYGYYLDLVEVEIDRDEWRRKSLYDAERSIAVAELVATRAPGRVLEVGVGYLGVLAALRAVLGPDVELSGLEHPGRLFLDDPRFLDAMADLRADLATCDIVTDPLPYPPGSFDVVVLSEVIEHLAPAALPRLLNGCRDALAPGGALVVSSPNLGAFFRVASLAIGHGHIMDIPVDLDRHPGVYGHQRLYGRNDIDVFAAQCGLRVVEWRWLNWERGYIDRGSARGKLLYAAQAAAGRVADRWSCGWACVLAA